MQEASGKLSRQANKDTYNTFEKVVRMVIELMRQFYDSPRYFRIMGEGTMDFVTYTNEGLQPRQNGDEIIKPEFDIKVTAQKATPYSQMANNELMLQLHNAGVFMPNNAPTSLALLHGMDFDQKDDIVSIVKSNAAFLQVQQELIGLSMALATKFAPQYLPQIQQMAMQSGMGEEFPSIPGSISPEIQGNESKRMENARATAQQATQVR